MKGWDGRTRALLRTLEIQEKLSTLPVTICPQLRSEVWRGPQLYLWAQRGLLHNVMISDYQLRIQGSPKGMPREYKGQPQRAFHCPYPCRIKSYLTVVKSWGSGEATWRRVLVINIYRRGLRGRDAEARLQDPWKEQAGFCKAQKRLMSRREQE